MKSLISFLTLLIFILSISDNMVMAQDDGEKNPVLDIDGNKLQTGANYYIVSDFRPGGGVTIYPLANKTCTYGVAQLPLFGDGLPVTFGNGGTDLGEVVRESTDLTIEFSPGILLCPAAWKVDGYNEASEQNFVTAGEVDGHEKFFRIVKSPVITGSYMFVFCPKVCESCDKICTDVGIHLHEGVRRFVLGGSFPSRTFMFKKQDQPLKKW